MKNDEKSKEAIGERLTIAKIIHGVSDEQPASAPVESPSTGSVPKWIQLKLREAVRLIHNEDDYYGGMDIVANLAGLPVDKLETKPTTLAEISEQNDKMRRGKGGE